MESYISDDIEALLKLKKGDSERLNRIKDLAENKKLISISDRKYVERLASQYLHKPEKRQIPAEKPIQKEKPREEIHQIEEPTEKKIVEVPQIMELPKQKIKSEKKKDESTQLDLSSKGKIIIGIAAIIVASIVIYAVAISDTGISLPEKETIPPVNLIPPYITLITDEESYQKADIISISGETNPIINGKIRLVIENSEGKIIWAENVQVKETGAFSTLLIAGGQGWEKSGEYSLSVTHDDLENDISFDFTS